MKKLLIIALLFCGCTANLPDSAPQDDAQIRTYQQQLQAGLITTAQYDGYLRDLKRLEAMQK